MRRIIALVSFGLAAAAFAEPGPVISPDDIVNTAIGHSYALCGADQEILAQEARARQAKAQGLPSLDLAAQAAKYAGLEDSALGQAVIPAVEDRYTASIGVTQPLFTGGRISGRRQAERYLADAARENRRAAEADLALQALHAYWGWSKAYHLARSLEISVQRMETHARDVANLHASGLATENDKLAADVLLDQTTLRLEQARNSVRVLRARIEFLTGVPLAESAVPRKADADAAKKGAGAGLDEARSARPETAARALEVRAADSSLRANRADFYPHLNAVARYEQSHPNAMFFPPADEWNDDAFVGVTLTWNLLDWGLTRGQAAEAAARAEQARLRRQQLDESIALEWREAEINFTDAASRLDVALRGEKSAELNLGVAADLWHNGLARHADVLDAQSKLTDAQYQRTAAEADVVLARAERDHAAGRLVEKEGNEP